MSKLKRKGIRPHWGLQLGPVSPEGLIGIFPFQRAWVLISVLLIFDLVFLIPAFTTFKQAASAWGRFEDLFDLVTALFLSAWLLGWLTAPLLMTTLLAILLFGRETVRAEPGQLEIVLGLPGLGIRARYALSGVRNLRLESPPKKSGKSWRGPHAAFNYGANSGEFGSGLTEYDLATLREKIEIAGGQSIRTRDATEEELSGEWAQHPAQQLMSADESAAAAGPLAPLTLSSPSTIVLILANLVPIAGAVFLGWDLGNVMVLYWTESAVIGFYNLCKMAVIAKWFAIPSGIFFISHFGAFMAVHFLFLYGIFIEGFESTSGGDLGEVAAMFGRLWPAIAILFISHGFSFFTNFLGRGEHRGRTIKTQMTEPYSRIIFMHMVLILGGGLALVLGDAVPVLMLIIAAKIWVDLRAHLKQHS